MAQGFYGADPEQLRALAKQFSSGSNQIRSSLETVSSLVNSTQSWQGPDASAFQQRWNSQVKQLGNTVVHALELGSTTLIKNADEQTATSQVDGGAGGNGGPGTNGGPGGSGSGTSKSPGEPGFFSQGSPFRDVWGKWGTLKNTIGLPKNLLGLGLMMRQGSDAFYDIAQWKNLANVNGLYGGLSGMSDIAGLKNLSNYFPSLKGAAGFLEETPAFFADKGDDLKALGMGGLGRALGWAGVGFNLIDAADKAQAGDGWGAAGSVAKAGLGVACFLPPPVGTVAQVASVGIAIYEIPAVKNFVDSGLATVGNAVGNAAQESWNAVSNAVKDPGKFANDVGKGIQDLGKGAADFFGW
ncbi:WXG100 family type VII secretion target [Agreia sp. VKM Ac-1783]|uniref:WXG100 family type VII secretion target n=1 Tax=Agreia sp. VKM Ac-1783 TaxID=1938889 RepID=UPI000A2ADB23|nr:WXG100 family type VII secretion target [Agreia sp. VKM Ac-1783]SMQ71481.1 Uncharacterized conserved protein YukE [Agreia sp. VKM Ac-1783]